MQTHDSNSTPDTASCDSLERGEIARKKLLEAGLKIFSEVGYEKASTRQIAGEAGVNIAAIPYYYSSKEGLYIAVIDSTIEYYRNNLGDSLDIIKAALANPATTPIELNALLDRYMRKTVQFVLQNSPEREQISRIYSREQLDPTSAFERLYTGFVRDMHETIASLVERILSSNVSAAQAKIVAQTLLGQVTVFKSSRRAVLHTLGWTDYNQKDAAEIETLVMFQINAIMHAYQHSHQNKSSPL